jgi:hypothetical protein
MWKSLRRSVGLLLALGTLSSSLLHGQSVPKTAPRPTAASGVDLLAAPALPPSWNGGTGTTSSTQKRSAAVPMTTQDLAEPRATTSPRLPAAAPVSAVKPTAAVAPAARPRKPYVTQGTIIFDEDAPPRVSVTPRSAPVTDNQPIDTVQLRRKVVQACGKLATDVRVSITPERIVKVHVKAAGSTSSATLAERILQLPEIASPNVKLEIDALN